MGIAIDAATTDGTTTTTTTTTTTFYSKNPGSKVTPISGFCQETSVCSSSFHYNTLKQVKWVVIIITDC